MEWPLRRVLRGNENIAEAYFNDSHRAPAFDRVAGRPTCGRMETSGSATTSNRQQWVLNVQGTDSAPSRQVTMAQIRELPRVEQITQLNCIEGWT